MIGAVGRVGINRTAPSRATILKGMSVITGHAAPDVHPAHGLYVVETDDGQAYLGQVNVDRPRGVLTVRTGRAGRPAVLDLDDVEEIYAASAYPGIVLQD